MANPTPYSPSYGFTGFQSENPTDPLPGNRLDTELFNVEQTTDELINALGEVRRSDGALQNGIVTPESMSTSALALTQSWVFKGDWAEDTAYSVGDVVSQVGATYVVIVNHTSSSDFQADLDAGKLMLFANPSGSLGEILFQAFDGDGSTTSFNLGVMLTDVKQVQVFVDQTIVDPADLSTTSTNIEIATAPPVGERNVLVFGTDLAATTNAASASASAATATTQAGIATTQAGIATTQADIATTQAGIATTAAATASDAADIVTANIDAIETVNANATNINTVAGISGDVTTVAGIAANVTAVAGNATNVNTVAGSIDDVNAVGTNIVKVSSVADNMSDVTAVADNEANIDTLAGFADQFGDLSSIATDAAASADSAEASATTATTAKDDAEAAASVVATISADFARDPTDRVGEKPDADHFAIEGYGTPSDMIVSRDTPATTIDKRGRVETVGNNILRPEYRDGVLLGWRVGGQRTNLLTAPSDLTDVAWIIRNGTISENVTIAPDGTLTADKITEDTSTNVHGVEQAEASSSGTWTYSAFLAPAERTFAIIGITDNTTGQAEMTVNLNTGETVLNPSTGAWTGVTGKAERASDGFWRAYITATQGAGTAINARTLVANDAGLRSYTGDGVSGIYAWGAQLENASFPSSYTEGTRDTDSVKTHLSTVPGFPTDGSGFSMYWFGHTAPGIGGSQWLNTLDDGTTVNFATLYRRASDNVLALTSYVGGAPQAGIIGPSVPDEHHVHMAATVQYNNTSLVLAVEDMNLGNGLGKSILVGTDTNCAVPSGLTTLIDQNRSGLASPGDGITERSGLFINPKSVAELMAFCDFP
jgi:hypothetical protein